VFPEVRLTPFNIGHDAEDMQRAGHVILDGVVDPTIWMSYKVTFNTAVVGSSSHLPHQFLRPSLMDTEAACFGLADACVAAGTAGCKLMEFVPNATTEADMAALLTGVHDVTDFLQG